MAVSDQNGQRSQRDRRPRLLVGDELTRGELVVACPQPLAGARAYYLVLPEGNDNPPVTQLFKDWLLDVLHTDAAG